MNFRLLFIPTRKRRLHCFRILDMPLAFNNTAHFVGVVVAPLHISRKIRPVGKHISDNTKVPHRADSGTRYSIWSNQRSLFRNRSPPSRLSGRLHCEVSAYYLWHGHKDSNRMKVRAPGGQRRHCPVIFVGAAPRRDKLVHRRRQTFPEVLSGAGAKDVL